MMSSAGTSRASRSSKDKTVKIQTPQNVKSEGPPKSQATAEQMRLAQMIAADKNDIEDPVVLAKVKQVMELTGRDADDVIVALHDCDQDPNRAINMLLEGEDHQQGAWKESTKRKKGKAPIPNTKGDGAPNHTDTREKSRDRDDFPRDNGPPRDRERRGRQPPRLARKNREREENERNSQRNQRPPVTEGEEGEVRERSFERGRGRGRGRMNGVRHRDMDSCDDSEAVYVNHAGQMNGGGGRGRGRGGRSYRSSRYDKGPQIDTWTNETAENAEKENKSWGEMGEDWGTDEWTGSLEETKVFTATSVSDQPSKGFSTTVGDNDAKMFTAPAMQVESQIFSSNITIENSNQSALNDSTNTLQNSIGQNQNSIGTSSHTLGQRLDLGLLLQKPSTETQPTTSQAQSQFMSQFSKQTTESLKNAMGVGSQNQQQQQYMSQFSKEATDTIKSMMGIGTTSSSHQPPSSVASPVVRPPMTSQAQSQPLQQTQPLQQQQQQQQQQSQQQQPQQQQQQQQQQALAQQRAKPQRSKLPPPSKIPASAVEMPGHVGSFQLDVQFGNWDFAPSESSGFSFGSRTDVSSSYSTPVSTTTTASQLSSQSNHLPQEPIAEDTTPSAISPNVSSAAPSKPHMSSMDNIAQNSDRSPRSNVFQNSTSPATTPNKDFSQSRLDQSRKMTPPDPIPFPSDRKTSPHYSQRSNHTSGTMNNGNKNTASPSQTYSQNYSSNYPSSGYQSSTKSPSSGYNSHQSNSLSGNNLSSGMQSHMSSTPSQYSHQSHSGYPSSSSFQSQNAFSNQGQSSLYQSSSQGSGYSSQSPTTYQGQTSSSSYQSQSASSYPSQSSSSYHGRDNQSSSSSYQPSVSQTSSSHYQTSGSQSSNSYQRDNQQSQSGYQSYGSSSHQSHQNSLQSSSMTMSTTKLSDSLSKVSMKDPSLDSHQSPQNSYEHSSATTTPTITAATTTTASLSGGSASVTSALGMTTATTVTTSTKSSLPVTSKAPPNLPPGVPLIGHNYMMQPGMPFAAFGLAQQPAMYSYEELQLLQQRLPMHGYYDMPFQPPTTLTGRDQGTLANVPYTAGADGKLGRVDAQSPVQAQTSQPGQNQQQTYMNPTIPPGYNYYYPGGMLPSAYSYTTPMFPVPSVTNAAHGGTTANAQFQKPNAYGSHAYNTGYDDLGSQTQDFSKYGGASQSQSKASAGGSVSSNATDLSGSTYGKTHTQSYEKANFHAATPPPFNMPLSTGTQAGPMAPTAAYGAPYVPMMPHQAHSQMLHPHMQQDSTGGSSRGSQPNSSQPKPGVTKPYSTGYWSTN